MKHARQRESQGGGQRETKREADTQRSDEDARLEALRQPRGLAIFQCDLLEHHSKALRRTWSGEPRVSLLSTSPFAGFDVCSFFLFFRQIFPSRSIRPSRFVSSFDLSPRSLSVPAARLTIGIALGSAPFRRPPLAFSRPHFANSCSFAERVSILFVSLGHRAPVLARRFGTLGTRDHSCAELSQSPFASALAPPLGPLPSFNSLPRLPPRSVFDSYIFYFIASFFIIISLFIVFLFFSFSFPFFSFLVFSARERAQLIILFSRRAVRLRVPFIRLTLPGPQSASHLRRGSPTGLLNVDASRPA